MPYEKNSLFFFGAYIIPATAFLFITRPAFNVYSSPPFIYELVPSIGSINHKSFRSLVSTSPIFSSDTISIFGDMVFNFSIIISFTAKSPLVTGVLSSFVLILSFLLKRSIDSSPAFKKVGISSKIIF